MHSHLGILLECEFLCLSFSFQPLEGKGAMSKIVDRKIAEGTLRSPRNEVFLQGRVTSEPIEKQLPSGDSVVEFRIVIDRPRSRSTKREVDTLDIAVWLAKPRRRALTLAPDDWVAIDGSVRRRFWRAPTGVASRWQVEASQLRRL